MSKSIVKRLYEVEYADEDSRFSTSSGYSFMSVAVWAIDVEMAIRKIEGSGEVVVHVNSVVPVAHSARVIM